MKIKDYSIIETEWINNYIQILSDKIKSAAKQPLTGDIYSIDSWTKQLEVLIKVKSKLKPLIPIVENAFDKGSNSVILKITNSEKNTVGWSKGFTTRLVGEFIELHPRIIDKENYINNTIIE
jgi:hypothetical protein